MNVRVGSRMLSIYVAMIFGQAIMLMSNMGGKLAILAVVPKALAGQVSAKAWSQKAGPRGLGARPTARC